MDWYYIAREEDICNDFLNTFEKYVCDKNMSLDQIRHIFDILNINGDKFINTIKGLPYRELHIKQSINLDKSLCFYVKVYKDISDRYTLLKNWG